MPYQKTTWVSGTTPASATNMNNLESQYSEATQSFNQDLFPPFVLSGLVASKDGSVSTQLDVTAGVAYLLQSDSTLRRRAPTATNLTTSVVSTTYYLDLNPDGTWSWGTAHSGQANYLPICQVTTDASGNISTVTDKRSLNPTLLAGLAGTLGLPQIAGNVVATGYLGTAGGPVYFDLTPINGESAGSVRLGTTNGASGAVNLRIINATTGQIAIVSGLGGVTSFWDHNGNFTNGGALASLGGQASAGSLGVPVIVAQALNQHITVTTKVMLLTFTPTVTGMYSFVVDGSAGANSVGKYELDFTSGLSSGGTQVYFIDNGATPPPSANQLSFYAAAGNAITVYYTDTVSPVNDYVSVVLMRLT